MPIATDHLRESRLGRVIMFMKLCPRELPELRKQAAQLIRKCYRYLLCLFINNVVCQWYSLFPDIWCKPLLNRNANDYERTKYGPDIVSPIDEQDVRPET